jgi:hypothetical protein
VHRSYPLYFAVYYNDYNTPPRPPKISCLSPLQPQLHAMRVNRLPTVRDQTRLSWLGVGWRVSQVQLLCALLEAVPPLLLHLVLPGVNPAQKAVDYFQYTSRHWNYVQISDVNDAWTGSYSSAVMMRQSSVYLTKSAPDEELQEVAVLPLTPSSDATPSR